MADFTFKSKDTVPELEFTLQDQDGLIDLSAAEAIELVLKSNSYTLEGACEKVDEGATGRAKYVWKEGDTAQPGDYEMEVKITWASGKVQSVPNTGVDKVVIEESLT